MATKKASGQITITDQNDAVAFQSFISSNQPTTQIFTQDNNTYNPNWAASPFLVLTPELYVSGIPGNSIAVPGRIKPGSGQWRRNGVLLANSGDYAILPTAPFSLTVKKNENVGGGNVKFEFSAIVVDPNNNLETPFSTTISFNTVLNASAGLMAIVYSETGTVFQNNDIPFVTLTCDLFRGSELLTANVAYQWYKRDSGIFAPTTASAASTTSQNTVTLTSVANVAVGSPLQIGANTYVVTAVNIASKVVTLDKNLIAAVASGAAVTSPYHEATTGAGWAKIDSSAYFAGITGFAGKTLTVPANAVINMAVFKCIAKDNSSGASTAGQSAQAVETVNDMSDPITINITAPEGDVIKNGTGVINLTAQVWQGEPIDEAGTQYNYNWVKYNANGTIDGSWVRTGKTVTITPADINGKSTFVVSLMTKD